MNRKAVSIFTFQRILFGSLVPGDWPVWLSGLGHEIIMCKVGPFPTCCSLISFPDLVGGRSRRRDLVK